ncbi:C-type lectin domain family 10 member A-like [Lates calcarifer]|uniref:C-type lectin domain family 10 member A-like n=1 Tax=Lates calcarifer TaxID=8187 RepID=A0AAJ8DLY4_LATCA|nr:C-type lectin domain family 10 member A-like [Lates calcarifer]
MDHDGRALWVKGLSRFRRWLFPALTAVVVLVLIIALGATNANTSSRLWSAEQSVSNLSDIIQSLNASLQQAHETAKAVKQLQFAVDNNKDQLNTATSSQHHHSTSAHTCSPVHLSVCLCTCLSLRVEEDGCCPLDWKLFGSSCYFFSASTLSWNKSRDWCESHQSHLIILTNDKEWDFVTHQTIPELFWVGLSDGRTGRWEWVNQNPYTIDRRRWVPGQPNSWTGHGLGPGDEDCAHLHRSGRLNDAHCSKPMRYICQKHSLRP